MRDTGRSEAVEPKVEITARDAATLRWVARWWGVTVTQVDRWWRLPAQAGLHRGGTAPRADVVRRRLAAMGRAGLLASHRLPTSPAYSYAVTAAGLQVAGLPDWTTPRWRWSQFRHEHAVVEVALELLAAGFEVIAEREMRHGDALGTGRWSLVIATGRGGRSHYPDLWVRHGDASTWSAVEVELTRKSLARLTSILAAHRDRGTPVTYYTDERPIAEAVRRAAGQAGLADLQVRRLTTSTAGQLVGAGADRG